MATTTENISIKIGLDTSQFNSSVKGMLNELKALQKVDLTILSEADKKAVISRMGDLRDGISNIKKEITAADPSAFFQSFSTLAGPAIAAISGIATGMNLFGVESEKVDAIQRKLMGVITLLSTLQTIADANKLKGLVAQIPLQAAELKNRITNALLIKQETAAVVIENGVKTTLGKTTKGLTAIQAAYNAMVLANPIGLLVAAVAALAGGIYLLSKSMKDNTEVVDETQRSYDGLIIKNEELRKIHNTSYNTLKQLDLEYRVLTGSISEQEAAVESLYNTFSQSIYDMKTEYNKMIADVESNTYSVGNTLSTFWERTKYFFDFSGMIEDLKKAKSIKEYLSGKPENLSGGNIVQDLSYKSAKEQERIQKELNDRKELLEKEYQQRKINLNETAYQKLLSLAKDYGNSIITDDAKKAKILYEQRLADIETQKKVMIATLGITPEEMVSVQKAKLEAYKAYQYELLRIQKEENKKKKEEEKQLWDDTLKLMDDFQSENKKKLKEQSDAYEETLKLMEDMQKENQDFRIKNGLDTNETMMNNEIDALKKTLPYITASETEKQKARQNIIDKYTNIELDKEKQKLDYLEGIGIDVQSQRQKMELDLLQKSLDEKLITEEQFQIAKQAMIDKYDVAREEKQKVINEAIAAGFQILTDNIKANEEQDLENLQTYNDQKTKSIDDQLAASLISEKYANIQKEQLAKEIAAKEKAIKIKAAREQKLLAVFQIAIDTLVAVIKTLATLGPIAGSAVTPFIIASGAISAGAVLAKPIPQFAKGTKNAPGGMSIVGENGPELLNIPKGSEVVSNKDLSSLINNNNTISFDLMKSYIDQSFERYNQIPVVVSEYSITNTQKQVRNVKVNSEVQ